jgi:DNA polymerase-4
MDAFFAAVEVLANPQLRGRPVVVGGRPGSRGVVATASYEARPFGIRPGMAIGEAARRCPHAVFIGGDPAKYLFYSVQLLRLLREHSPRLEPFSIDEAFIELTGQAPDLAAGRESAAMIQAEVQNRLGLTASIGIGPNKLIAKMASGVEKPSGLTMLDRSRFRSRFWPRPVDDLWGVGEKTAAALGALGIRSIGELAGWPRPPLVRTFGVVGGLLQEMARGHDDTPLIPYDRGLPVKSMGHEHTLARDEADPARLEALLLRLTEQVARRLRQGGKRGRTVTLKLRFTDFRTITRRRTLPLPTDEERVIHPVACDLLARHRGREALRLLGVAVSGLTGGPATEELFAADRRHREVLGAVDALRDRFGDEVLIRASVLALSRALGPAREEFDARPANRRSLPPGAVRSRLIG